MNQSSARNHPEKILTSTAGERFSPGPWEVGGLDGNGQRVVSSEHIEICTCWHHSVGSIEKEMEANAHLISAAPDMYEALRVILALDGGEWHPERHAREKEEAYQRARAALAKAEGKS